MHFSTRVDPDPLAGFVKRPIFDIEGDVFSFLITPDGFDQPRYVFRMGKFFS